MSVPKLRFKEFDGDWLKLKYKDVLTIKYGKDHKSLNDGDIPVYGTGGLMRHVNKYLYDGESILIGRKGTIDKPKYINEKFWTVDTLFYTEIEESIVPLFLYQHALEVNWLGLNEATGVPSLNTTSIYNIDISIPSKEEQTKIAFFLSTVDEKISQLTQKHELLSQYKQGMMQKLFSQQIRFKADDGSEFGEWGNLKIFDLAKDKTLNNGVFNDQNKVGKGYKLINVLDMYINRDIDESRLKLLDLSKKEFEKNKVYYGDIFFTRSSLVKEGIAFSNVYLGNSNDVTYDGHLIKLTPDLDRVSPIFLNYVLKTNAVRKQLIKGGKTATMTTIGQQEVGNTMVPLPCLEEQTKIANFLSAIDQKIEVVAQQIEQAKQWKKGLLQQMFV
ncbi:restriction endonuclease subunit S [Acinetobacter baumannii]|uniref:restriction endonuclease subunit S n=1 Tax=Acinetobacter baumannii TaxID=470 RepID=UPI003891F89E